MSRRPRPPVTVTLTDHEATELTILLNIILTNDDQWNTMDLAALRRVSQKISKEDER